MESPRRERPAATCCGALQPPAPAKQRNRSALAAVWRALWLGLLSTAQQGAPAATLVDDGVVAPDGADNAPPPDAEVTAGRVGVRR